MPLQGITIVLWQLPLRQWIVLLRSDYQISAVQRRSRRCGMRWEVGKLLGWIGRWNQKSANSVHLRHLPCSRPWRIDPILNKFLFLNWTSFHKVLAPFASTRPVCWWFCRQLNVLNGYSSYFLPCDDPPQATQCPIQNCFSNSRRCLAMRSFASCCCSSSSLLSLDSSKSRWRLLDLFEERTHIWT